ncbi:MAG TPA: cell division protein CrgA [Actinomycetota bacterium]|nr:cell division protein CrgA [Actinomycetota bacterium]
MPRPRSKRRTSRRRYQVEPPRKRAPRPSPRWWGWAVLAVLGVGVAVVVLNYMGLMPGTSPSNGYLWLGLGFIAVGFLGATQWR